MNQKPNYIHEIMLGMYERGYNLKEIAEKTQCSEACVRSTLVKKGIHKVKKARRVSDYADYVEQRWFKRDRCESDAYVVAEISNEIGLSADAVRTYLSKMGFRIKKSQSNYAVSEEKEVTGGTPVEPRTYKVEHFIDKKTGKVYVDDITPYIIHAGDKIVLER